MKKRILTAAAVLLSLALLAGGVWLGRMALYQERVRRLEIQSPDFTDLKDGVYVGECDVDILRAEVRVEVESGRVTGILLVEHRNERGGAAEAVPGEIVRRQSLDVDAPAGATNSGKVIRKAVENALEAAKPSRE